jgi:hypothetical protein
MRSRLCTARRLGAVTAILSMAVAPPTSDAQGHLGARQLATEAAAELLPFSKSMPLPAQECDLAIGQAQVDYGALSAGQLDQAGKRALTFGKRTTSLTVNCPFESVITLGLRGPVGPKGQLLFGEKGTTRLTLGGVTLDGNAAWLSRETNPQERLDEARLMPGQRLRVITSNGEVPGKALLATLTIEPIVPIADTRVSDQTVWSTNATIELWSQ